jgi:hypothetical protein
MLVSHEDTYDLCVSRLRNENYEYESGHDGGGVWVKDDCVAFITLPTATSFMIVYTTAEAINY